MSHIRLALASALVSIVSMAHAQGLINQKALSLDAAQAIAQGALESCRAAGYHVSVSIVDGNGMLKAFVRDDGTGPHTVDLSRRKSYTALTVKRTTAETGKAWAAQTPPPNIEGTVGLGGGVPIRTVNEVSGAIGVSGAPGGDKMKRARTPGSRRSPTS